MTTVGVLNDKYVADLPSKSALNSLQSVHTWSATVMPSVGANSNISILQSSVTKRKGVM